MYVGIERNENKDIHKKEFSCIFFIKFYYIIFIPCTGYSKFATKCVTTRRKHAGFLFLFNYHKQFFFKNIFHLKNFF